MGSGLVLVESALEYAFSEVDAGNEDKVREYAAQWFRENYTEEDLQAASAALHSILLDDADVVHRYTQAHLEAMGLPLREDFAEEAYHSAQRAAIGRLGAYALGELRRAVLPGEASDHAYSDFTGYVDAVMGRASLVLAKSYFTGPWNGHALLFLGPHWTSFGALPEEEAKEMGKIAARSKAAGANGVYHLRH
jgi:hypothetical protein